MRTHNIPDRNYTLNITVTVVTIHIYILYMKYNVLYVYVFLLFLIDMCKRSVCKKNKKHAQPMFNEICRVLILNPVRILHMSVAVLKFKCSTWFAYFQSRPTQIQQDKPELQFPLCISIIGSTLINAGCHYILKAPKWIYNHPATIFAFADVCYLWIVFHLTFSVFYYSNQSHRSPRNIQNPSSTEHEYFMNTLKQVFPAVKITADYVWLSPECLILVITTTLCFIIRQS